jgi:hypothetical protein
MSKDHPKRVKPSKLDREIEPAQQPLRDMISNMSQASGTCKGGAPNRGNSIPHLYTCLSYLFFVFFIFTFFFVFF